MIKNVVLHENVETVKQCQEINAKVRNEKLTRKKSLWRSIIKKRQAWAYFKSHRICSCNNGGQN